LPPLSLPSPRSRLKDARACARAAEAEAREEVPTKGAEAVVVVVVVGDEEDEDEEDEAGGGGRLERSLEEELGRCRGEVELERSADGGRFSFAFNWSR
jgi:hypothetical protein